MKATPLAFFCLVLATFYPAFASFAGDGIDRGGGDVVWDTQARQWVLADPYLKQDGGMSNQLGCDSKDRLQISGALRRQLDKLSFMLTAYGARVRADLEFVRAEAKCVENVFPKGCKKDTSKQAIRAAFMEERVFGPDVQYCLVQKVPGRDRPLPLADPGEKQSRILGFSHGNYTYLDRDLFSSMGVEEQARTIVHERLHALPQAPSYRLIAAITDGLKVAMDLHARQAGPGKTDPSAEDLAALQALHDSMASLGMTIEGKFGVHPNGGGLVSAKASVSRQAFVGVGSLIGARVTADAGAEFWMSDICSEDLGRWIHFKGGSLVRFSSLRSCRVPLSRKQRSVVGPGARILSSVIRFDIASPSDPSLFVLEAGAEILRSKLNPHHLMMGARSRISDSRILGYQQEHTDPMSVSMPGLYLELGADATYSNAYLTLVAGQMCRKFLLAFTCTGELPILRIAPQTRIDMSRYGFATRWENSVELGYPMFPILEVYGETELDEPSDVDDVYDRRVVSVDQRLETGSPFLK